MLPTPGAYTLTAAGNNSAAIGSYAGTIALARSGPVQPNPVPERAMCVLVLAGLGAVRAAVRRRQPWMGGGACSGVLLEVGSGSARNA